MIRLKITTTTILLEDIAKIYQNKIWKLYRVPQKFLSDREFQFTSKFIEDLTKALGKKRTLFIAYYLSRSPMMDSILFSLFILFYFLCFLFFFFFYLQNNSGQGLSVTPSHQSQIDGVVTRLIMRSGKRRQKVLEQSDIIQHGQHMLASCNTHGTLGQSAQQLAQTMSNSI